MSVDHDIYMRHRGGAVVEEAPPPRAAEGRRMDSPSLSRLARALPGAASRCAAVAPASLSVMGGASDFTGALVLGTPLGDHVAAVAQPRTDGKLRIALPLRGDDHVVEVQAAELFHRRATGVTPQGRDHLDDRGCRLTLAVAATVAEAVGAGVLPAFNGGLSLAVASHAVSSGTPCVGSAACAATLAACAGALGCPVDGNDCQAVFQRVASDWLQVAPSLVDPVLSMLGEAERVSQMRTDGIGLCGSLPLPENVEVIGIDCGFTRDDAMERYTNARVATFMGRLLIDRIIQHDGAFSIPWDGYLSRISVSDYVDKFRNRLPTKISGREFLDRFGETGDPYTRIDPEAAYRVRSRTEHHIYEHARTCQFVERLAKASRADEETALREAGDLMEASHWSYGQRSALGSVQTDALAQLIRRHGEPVGVYGVKTVGQGCGGSMAVLMKTGDRAEQALDHALAEYSQQTGHTARLLRGSMAGCLVSGPRVL